jgi:hypothetical protein
MPRELPMPMPTTMTRYLVLHNHNVLVRKGVESMFVQDVSVLIVMVVFVLLDYGKASECHARLTVLETDLISFVAIIIPNFSTLPSKEIVHVVW